jgi:hypothetical protein
MRRLIISALIILLFAPFTFAEGPADSDTVSPECEKILADLKAAQDQHNAAHKAKGKAYFTWKRYFDQVHSDTYENTDMPLADSVKKCEGENKPGKDFCKGALEKYNEISPKEKSAKEALDKAQEKSEKTRNNYNTLLRQAAEMNCVMKKR